MGNVSGKSEDSMKSFAKKHAFLLLLAFCLVILILPLALRQNLIIPGDSPYYTLRIAEKIQNEGLISWDDLSYGGREIAGLPSFPFILSLINVPVQNMGLSFTLFNIVLGLLSFVMFYIILKNQEKKIKIIASFLFILSPPFIALFAGYSSLSIAFFLVLLAILLFIRNSYWSLLPFALLPFFSVTSTFLMIVFLIFYLFTEKPNVRLITFAIILQSIILFYIYGGIFLRYGLLEKLNFELTSISTIFLSDLGGKFGISIFTLFAAIIGIFELWERKYKSLYLYLFVAIVLVMSFMLNELLIYLSIFIVFLAAFGFLRLSKQTWKSDFLKKLTITALLCGVLFSGLSYVNQIAVSMPNEEIIQTLGSLKEFSSEGDLVLSHFSNGNWISYFADRPVYMDSNFRYAPNVNAHYHDANAIFQSRDAEFTREILDRDSISYIYITPGMKDGLVWESDNQGLLFLFDNSDLFIRHYNIDETEILQYNKTIEKL